MSQPASTKRVKLPPPPGWASPALQGLAFWIGHRRALYSGSPLGESALVAELCNLIHTHLPKTKQLRCEVQYADLKAKAKWLGPLARLDLLVSEHADDPKASPVPIAALEVKRAGAAKSLIVRDLKRLAALKVAQPGIRAFLVVVAEASLPKDYVNKDGEADTRSHAIPETAFRWKVRRVLKASHTFKKERIKAAQYVCLIEVLPRITPKPPLKLRILIKRKIKPATSSRAKKP